MKRDVAGINRLNMFFRYAVRKLLRALGMISIRERENDFVMQSVQQIKQTNGPKAKRVMDIGSSSSLLPLRMARLGYEVIAVDIRPYPFHHRNLKFICANVTDPSFGLDLSPIDIVTCISTLEHIGLGHYGDKMAQEGDRLTLAAIHRILKPGGSLLVTFPFIGSFSQDNFQRIYDPESVTRLFSEGWRLREEKYFIRKKSRDWVPASKEQALKHYFLESNNACFWYEACD